MKDLYEALDLIQAFVFVALGATALVQWRRRGGETAGWLAATFGVLAAVVIVGRFLPVHSDSQVVAWIRKLNIAVIVLFPYFLFRFMSSFERPPQWLSRLAVVLTAGTILFSFVLPKLPEEGDPDRPAIFIAFIVVLLVQWVTLSAAVGIRLWRGGRGQPTVARRRMRTLSLGALGLALALVIAGSAPPAGTEVTATQVFVQILALGSALLFLLGFAPPGIVRLAWRRREEAQLREAELGLMEAVDPSEIADVLLPHVSQLVGGRGAVLVGADGTVTGSYGLTPEEAQGLGVRAQESTGSSYSNSGSMLSVPMRSGALAVQSSTYTPFFGREETDMLQTLAVLAELALDRAQLFNRERESRDQLAEAQQIANVGSWEWEVEENRIAWSDEMYRIYGVDPDDFQPNFDSVSVLSHPDDVDAVRNRTQAAWETGSPFHSEYRIVRPTGDVRYVMAQGKVEQREGKPVRMIGTVQDITERKRQEEFRDRFIANAAHELRTPMTTLVGFVEMLARKGGHMEEPQMSVALDAMSRSGDRLTVLINNLLDLSKLQQGELEFELAPVPIEEVLHSAREAAPPPDGKIVEVDVQGAPVAMADRHRLDQILSNLLTNAYRYGGDRIVVAASDQNGSVMLSVSDDGPGIEPDLVPSLFDPFTRGAASSEVGGSGLGLAIVKMLVDASGGQIWHERQRPHGARFNVRLKRPS